MTEYNAPITEMEFLIKDVFDLNSITALPGYEEATPDMVDAILEEAGKLGRDVIAPLAQASDEQGATWKATKSPRPRDLKKPTPNLSKAAGTGSVLTRNMAAWACLSSYPTRSAKFGIPLPSPLVVPDVDRCAIEAMHHHASDEQKAIFLKKWSQANGQAP